MAFCGLALTIRANPHDIALAGVAFSFMAACGRTAILLITRATLQDADPQMTTWYTILGSTVVLGAITLAAWDWQPPVTTGGWAAMIGVSFGTTIGVLSLFMSIKRIGPFRSALIMYLEPLLSTVLSAPVLGDVITPLQALGGAVMLAALIFVPVAEVAHDRYARRRAARSAGGRQRPEHRAAAVARPRRALISIRSRNGLPARASACCGRSRAASAKAKGRGPASRWSTSPPISPP